MDYNQILELKKNGKYSEIAAYGSSINPESLDDYDACFQIAYAFEQTGQYKRSIEWYTRVLDGIGPEEIYPELLRIYITIGDYQSAEDILSHMEEDGEIDIMWFSGKYEVLKGKGGSIEDRIDSLQELLDEGYDENYMLELSALYVLENRSSDAKSLCTKLIHMFNHGECFVQASELLNKINANEAYGFAMALEQELRVQPKDDSMPSTEDQQYDEATPVPDYDRCENIPPAIMDRFKNVVGLDTAKRKLADFYTTLQYREERISYDIGNDANQGCHFIVRGAKGTGKSMIANTIAGLLNDFGMSPEDQPEVVPRISLQNLLSSGDYNQLLSALSASGRRTIIIDNIHEIYGINDTQSTNTILEGLAKSIEICKTDYSFILTGDSDAVDKLLNTYPLLQGIFLFDISIPSYSMNELIDIAHSFAKQHDYTLSKGASLELERILEPQVKLPSFMSAKSVEIIIGKAIPNIAKRISNMDYYTKEQLMVIEASDFACDQDGESVEELLKQLDNLAGLASVKERVKRMVARAQAFKEAQERGIKPKGGFGTLHMVFKGNAGTGKTTVARILGNIYKKLGILRNGDKTVECGRADLIGAYQGHTARNVKDKISEALGGVLFIDEAYSLCNGSGDSFGMEAINTLVAEIENRRGDLMVIIAGYTDDMDEFLRKNQGLSSRFPNSVVFEDYSAEEMASIFYGMVKSRGMGIEEGCEKTVTNYIRSKASRKDFGNARGVRNLVDKVLECQNMRLMDMKAGGEMPAAQNFIMIKKEDMLAANEKSNIGVKTLEDWMEDLNALTGLESVKRKVEEMVFRMQIIKERIARGQIDKSSFGTLHMVFKGNAGTGKTTVARIIAGIYNTLGILPDGDVFVECGRADLVAPYAGQTAPKVKEMVDKAMGGVLFIDEAYALCSDDSDAFGKEAVDALVADMENRRSSLMVILAGYSGDMDKFLMKNQGLASRVPTEILFEDYSIHDMMHIFNGMLKKNGFHVDEAAQGLVQRLLEKKSKARDFGNARGVRNVMEKVMDAQSVRLGKRMALKETLNNHDFEIVLAQDIEALLGETNSQKKPLSYWMEQLNALTGLAGVKSQVQKKVDTLLVGQQMEQMNLGKPKGFGTLHMVFKGNAGTGKTTVARIIAGIYNSLGILPDGDVFIECGRADLVGQYQGQTAPKVKEMVEKALGGVLFIDEAYSLCRDANDTFGREAIDTLIADMENYRGSLIVILAGYSDDMDAFFQHNQGLSSRVPTEIIFEDYTSEEMLEIFINILKEQGLQLAEEAKAEMLHVIEEKSKVKNFGNARGVRNLSEKAIENRNTRLGEKLRLKEELSREDYLTITHEDIEKLKD